MAILIAVSFWHSAKAIDIPTITPITAAGSAQDITKKVVGEVIDFMLYLAGVLAVIYLIYSGIVYITSAGDSEKATKGKTGVINAVIGIVIVLLCLLIVALVQDVVKGKFNSSSGGPVLPTFPVPPTVTPTSSPTPTTSSGSYTTSTSSTYISAPTTP